MSLVRKFQNELKNEFPCAKVYTVDANPAMAPATMVSDGSFSVPLCTSGDYLQVLLELCIKYQVRVVIPTIDTELEVLSANKERMRDEGIEVLVSDSSFVHICRDKRKSFDFFRQHSIRTPELRDKTHPEYPLFAKPYDGSRSLNTHVIRKKGDFTEDILTDPKLIFMEYFDREEFKEFTVDMYYGRDNRVKSIVPRERLEVRDGEVTKGVTRKNLLVGFLFERMKCLPGVVGSICIQLFYRERSSEVVGIEVNPRFGGGYPLSYCAGANYPRMIIEEYLLGHAVEYSDDWKDGTVMLRYDDEIISYEEDRTCL